jgi:GrpB-like predicted nucleotidyltransferase (UPF0157 family)
MGRGRALDGAAQSLKPARDNAAKQLQADAMKIEAFDESLAQRNILPYTRAYADVFARVQRYVEDELAGVTLVHIGSTAIVGLRGKPMVDAGAIVIAQDLRAAQREFEPAGFHRRAVWADVHADTERASGPACEVRGGEGPRP